MPKEEFSLMMFEQDLVIILETVRIIAIALSPVTPSLSWRIYAQLGYSQDQFDAATWVSLYIYLFIYISIYHSLTHKRTQIMLCV
jgi:methionyl-tRNA synthetase